MNRPGKIHRRHGFSLLELLAVMSIMAALTTLAVTSYFAAVRGMTRRGAVKHIANTLILARQRACMESTRVSVVMFNEVTGVKDTDVTPSYVLSKEVGRISFIPSQGRLVDEFSPLESMFGTESLGSSYRGSIRLYNLTQGKWSQVFPWVTSVELKDRKSPYTQTFHDLNAYAFEINGNVQNLNAANWNVGDSYGIEASPVGSLPRGFWFSEMQDKANRVVTFTFLPDGTAELAGQVTIGETHPPQKRTRVTVRADGTIEYTERWN